MDEITCATASLVYVSFGLFEEIRSDSGSDFMSYVIKQFNLYLGMKRMVSIVDRHTSNGQQADPSSLEGTRTGLTFGKQME